ncbi:MAG TPA: hypothetical protein VMH24_08100, partial [Candidatus Sulfotelmatobacter sp.]|nr:hypothetical protein [Candidatus Sulfotelmatobacter sp.]
AAEAPAAADQVTPDPTLPEAVRPPISWVEMTQPAPSVPHMAMPRLMGQPAYARPPRPLAVETPRPIDPDDLPIEAFRSEEDQALAARLVRGASETGNGHDAALRPSSVGGLRAIAGRLFGRG